jgi:hypothetical protein
VIRREWSFAWTVNAVVAGRTVVFDTVEIFSQDTNPQGYTRIHFSFRPGIAGDEVGPRFTAWRLGISDDLHTQYQNVGGGINPEGGDRSIAQREFIPAIPADAATLRVRLVTEDGETFERELELRK